MSRVQPVFLGDSVQEAHTFTSLSYYDETHTMLAVNTPNNVEADITDMVEP